MEDTTKFLRISKEVHKELKIYSASSGESMNEAADKAILLYLYGKTHKFSDQTLIKKKFKE